MPLYSPLKLTWSSTALFKFSQQLLDQDTDPQCFISPELPVFTETLRKLGSVFNVNLIADPSPPLCSHCPKPWAPSHLPDIRFLKDVVVYTPNSVAPSAAQAFTQRHPHSVSLSSPSQLTSWDPTPAFGYSLGFPGAAFRRPAPLPGAFPFRVPPSQPPSRLRCPSRGTQAPLSSPRPQFFGDLRIQSPFHSPARVSAVLQTATIRDLSPLPTPPPCLNR